MVNETLSASLLGMRYGITQDILEDLAKFELLPPMVEEDGEIVVRHLDVVTLIQGLLRAHLDAAKAAEEIGTQAQKVRDAILSAPDATPEQLRKLAAEAVTGEVVASDA